MKSESELHHPGKRQRIARLLSAIVFVLGALSLYSAEPAVAQPVIQNFSPISGAPGASVTIVGGNFFNVREVRFNNERSLFTVASPQIIYATVPLDATTGPISVITASGVATTFALFTVAPRIVDFSPTNGAPGTVVTIEGANFTGATGVQFNGKNAANPVVVAPTQMRAVVPTNATSGPISVVTPAGMATSTNNFIVLGVQPVITDFSPTNGVAGSSVVIEGQNFLGATAVKFNGVNSVNFSVTAATQIAAIVPAGATTGPISVTTPAGTGTSAKVFLLTSGPIITGFTPSSGTPGASVIIDGFNFTGATAVRFNGANARDFSVTSPTQLRATVPTNAATGPISIATPKGTNSSVQNFVVTLAPVVSDFFPTNGPPGTIVTINGVNFAGVTNVLCGTNAASFSVVAPTQITAIIPALARSGLITIRSIQGIGTSTNQFTVTTGAPIITSVSPAAGAPGLAVLIEGFNFTGATAVQFNGTNANFSVTAPTQILTVVPDAANSGPIAVTTPAGTGANNTRFIVAPRIISFSPTNGAAGSRVIIRGANFADANAVRFNGAPGSFVIDSATQLTVTVPTNAVGGTISVANAGGIVASTNSFVVLPNITSVIPATAPVGANVRIFGTHLSDATSVRFGGAAAAFVIVSANEIQAMVPGTAVTGPITVATPRGTATSPTNFVVVTDADLSVNQADFPDPVVVGENVAYILTLTNRGPAMAVAVTLNDTFGSRANFVSADASQGNFSRTPGGIIWNLGNLNSGTSARITLVLSPSIAGTMTNVVMVSSSAPDPDVSNNTRLETTTVLSAGATLSIQRMADNRLAISWPVTAAGFTLQGRDSFSVDAGWVAVMTTPVNDGILKTIILPAAGRTKFFRLIKP